MPGGFLPCYGYNLDAEHSYYANANRRKRCRNCAEYNATRGAWQSPISYMGYEPYGLYFARALDADGASWPQPLAVDDIATEATGMLPSMEIWEGHPAVAYHIQDTLDLLFIEAEDADGATWAARSTVDQQDETGLFASFEIINGAPAIAYYESD